MSAAQAAIGLRLLELLIERVGRYRMVVLAVGSANHETSPHLRANSTLTHEFGHGVLRALDTLGLRLGVQRSEP